MRLPQHLLQILGPAREGEEAKLTVEVGRGRVIGNFETVRRRRDGSAVHLSITAAPIRDVEGEVVAVSAILRDIGSPAA